MLLRIFLIITLLTSVFSESALSQGLAEVEKEYFPGKKAKNFAIWSAQYAFISYECHKKIAFSENLNSLMVLADSAIRFKDMSLVAADSALANCPDSVGSDSIRAAIDYLNMAIEEMNYSNELLEQVFLQSTMEEALTISRQATLAAGNGTVSSYTASLYLTDGKKEEEEEEELVFESAIVKRLEVDESVFRGLVNNYEDKISAIDDLIQEQNDRLFSVDEEQLEEVNKKLDSLSGIRERLVNRLMGSNQRLQTVSEKLYAELSKDIQESVEKRESIFEIKSEVYYDKDNPVPINTDLPDGLVYQIQIGYFSLNSQPEWSRKLYPVFGEPVSGSYIRYSTGIFFSYRDASKALSSIQALNIPDAFITAYEDGVKISTSQAIRIEKNVRGRAP